MNRFRHLCDHDPERLVLGVALVLLGTLAGIVFCVCAALVWRAMS